MTQPFLQTIDDLRHTVKVNASFKFEILEPYLQDAFDRYIVPYLGEALVDRLYREPLTEDILTIKMLASRTLGPLAVALASPELGVLIGDSGHTVSRNDKFTVASDQKIARSEERNGDGITWISYWSISEATRTTIRNGKKAAITRTKPTATTLIPPGSSKITVR